MSRKKESPAKARRRLIDAGAERVEVYCFKISVCVDVGYEAGEEVPDAVLRSHLLENAAAQLEAADYEDDDTILSLTLEDAYEG